jgi:hypothetical protein
MDQQVAVVQDPLLRAELIALDQLIIHSNLSLVYPFKRFLRFVPSVKRELYLRRNLELLYVVELRF